MLGIGHKFTALTTALIVLVAHATCVCRGMAAPAAAQAAAGAHHCCKHQKTSNPTGDDHTKDHDGSCRHCDGFAVPVAKAADHVSHDAPALQFVTLAVTTAAAESLRPSPGCSEASSGGIVSPPTLL